MATPPPENTDADPHHHPPRRPDAAGRRPLERSAERSPSDRETVREAARELVRELPTASPDGGDAPVAAALDATATPLLDDRALPVTPIADVDAPPPRTLPPGYRGLRVWQRSLELATGVYALALQFPTEAQLPLAVPLRRAAGAVAAAIAEGNVRYSTREYAHYVSQAIGTVAEVETLLCLATRLELTNEVTIAPLLSHCSEISRMLRALGRTIQRPGAPIESGPSRRRSSPRDSAVR